jgi:hypothetical protein
MSITTSAALTDEQVFRRAARIVSQPSRDAASSFVLHAPLELMARRLLLPFVPETARPAARERMLWVAAEYERAVEPADVPAPVTIGSIEGARDALLDAIAAGDLHRVDGLTAALLDVVTIDEMMVLAEPLLPSLAAAGHAPIGFAFASRLAFTGRAAIALLRPLLHEAARAPQLRMHWVAEIDEQPASSSMLAAALAATPLMGLPGTDFIFPVVHQVDGEVAREVIAPHLGNDITTMSVATLRVAALSMLQDDPRYAPYGWTHCLTLPHGIFEIMPWISDRRPAAAIAATYVAAFRAAEGRAPIELAWRPEPNALDLVDALDASPAEAGGAWYHATDEALGGAVPTLVGRAAVHEDAHFAKYTLACIASAQRDHAGRNLYLAAAASLAACWASQSARSTINGA